MRPGESFRTLIPSEFMLHIELTRQLQDLLQGGEWVAPTIVSLRNVRTLEAQGVELLISIRQALETWQLPMVICDMREAVYRVITSRPGFRTAMNGREAEELLARHI